MQVDGRKLGMRCDIFFPTEYSNAAASMYDMMSAALLKNKDGDMSTDYKANGEQGVRLRLKKCGELCYE